MIPANRVFPNPKQPRKTFNEERLIELGLSIAENGLKQPIQVMRSAERKGHYMIVAGERRWRCFCALEYPEIPAHILPDNIDAFVWALIENTNREDINPIEEAMALAQLKDEQGLSQIDIGRRIGKNDKGFYVSTRLSLLTLPSDMQDAVATGQLSVAVGLVFTRRCQDAAEMAGHYRTLRKLAHGSNRLTQSMVEKYFESVGKVKKARQKRESTQTPSPSPTPRQQPQNGKATTKGTNGAGLTEAPILNGARIFVGALEEMVGPNVATEESRKMWHALSLREKGEVVGLLNKLDQRLVRLKHMLALVAKEVSSRRG